MAVYDVLRVWRMLVRHGKWWQGIEDFLYWVYAAGTTFMLLYRQNDGRLRAYAIAGVLAGMIVYDRMISRIFFKALKILAKVFKIDRKTKPQRDEKGRTT